MAIDPLQLCPVDKWPELEDIFKTDWPRSIVGLTALQAQRYILQCGLDYAFRVYCPYGDLRNGIVALIIKRNIYELVVQCPNDDVSKLDKALQTTTIIDWKKIIQIPFVSKNMINCIKQIISEKKMEIATTIALMTYILDENSPLFNVTFPPGCYFDLLSLGYADKVNSTWPHRYQDSNLYFELLIKAKFGYGLFKENKLVSWIFIRDVGVLLHLFTLQEERRKGYGELLLKLLSNDLLRKGKHVVAHCVEGNENARKLYQKLNFLATTRVEWFSFTGKT